jgi:hypothetical protein
MRKAGFLLLVLCPSALEACSSDSVSSPDAGAGPGGDCTRAMVGACPPAAPRWTPNVQASRGGDLGFEPAVAADGAGRVYVPYMQIAAGGAKVVLAFSRDEGATFEYPWEHAVPGGFAGDVAAAADGSGNAYVTWIDYHYVGGMMTSGDVMLAQSHDAGSTWAPAQVVSPGVEDNVAYFNDRPWIRVDPAGAIYLVFAHDRMADGETRARPALLRSGDQGQNFDPLRIVDTPSSAAGTFLHAFFGFAVVGQELWIPFAEEDMQLGGARSVGLLRGPSAGGMFTPQGQRVLATGFENKAFPSVAGSPGSLWLGFEEPDGERDRVRVARNDAAGGFGVARTASDSPGDQQRATMAATPGGGCMLAWIDQNDGSPGVSSVLVDAAGTPGAPLLVSDAPLDLGDDQIGQGEDYLSLEVAGQRAYLVWADRRRLPQAIYLATLGLGGM